MEHICCKVNILDINKHDNAIVRVQITGRAGIEKYECNPALIVCMMAVNNCRAAKRIVIEQFEARYERGDTYDEFHCTRAQAQETTALALNRYAGKQQKIKAIPRLFAPLAVYLLYKLYTFRRIGYNEC